MLARLLYVDTATKTTGLSCLTHLINLRLPTAVPRMGQVCLRVCLWGVGGMVTQLVGCLCTQPPAPTHTHPYISSCTPLFYSPKVFTDAKVTHVDAGLGLLLRLPMDPEPAAGFAHISNLADDTLTAAEVAKRFKVSRCNCMGLSEPCCGGSAMSDIHSVHLNVVCCVCHVCRLGLRWRVE